VSPHFGDWGKQLQGEAVGSAFRLHDAATTEGAIWSSVHQVRMHAYGRTAQDGVYPLVNRWGPKAIQDLADTVTESVYGILARPHIVRQKVSSFVRQREAVFVFRISAIQQYKALASIRNCASVERPVLRVEVDGDVPL
jgi:hypothetical protein